MVSNNVAVYINGINYTAKLVTPVKWSGLLDESLDEAMIALRHVKKRDVFMPGLPVELHVKNTVVLGSTSKTEEKILYYLLAGDASEETPAGSGLYDHDISLVEPTKYAELVICDTQTITNVIGRDFTAGVGAAQEENEDYHSIFG